MRWGTLRFSRLYTTKVVFGENCRTRPTKLTQIQNNHSPNIWFNKIVKPDVYKISLLQFYICLISPFHIVVIISF